MELVFVTVIGAGIGVVLRYLLPHRTSHGMLLVPAAAAAVTAAVWVGLVWLGWTFDGGWIWAVSLTAGGVCALALALILPPLRSAADERMLHRLSGGRA